MRRGKTIDSRDVKRFLAADVGGTKTDIGLFEDAGDGFLNALRQVRFENRDYAGLEPVVAAFLGEAGADVEAATFAVAAPVEEGRARLVNIDWEIDVAGLQERFNLKKARLINDLVATAWGIPLLKGEDLFILNEGRRREGNVAVIAPGTGLGEAVLFWDGERHVVSATEGGHADFAPANMGETGLLAYLREIFGGHVSYERVVSGPGLKNIHDFLSSMSAVPAHIEKRFQSEDPPMVITEEGLKKEGRDHVCRQALEMFVSVLGAEAGNLALKSLSVGGLYVAGGMAPRIIDVLKGPIFMHAFTAKGRFSEFLSRIPVTVVLNQKTALLGAANHARAMSTKSAFKLFE